MYFVQNNSPIKPLYNKMVYEAGKIEPVFPKMKTARCLSHRTKTFYLSFLLLFPAFWHKHPLLVNILRQLHFKILYITGFSVYFSQTRTAFVPHLWKIELLTSYQSSMYDILPFFLYFLLSKHFYGKEVYTKKSILLECFKLVLHIHTS